MSEERARMQSIRFQNLDAIYSVLDAAYAEGLRTFMCTTHERVADICEHVRTNRQKYEGYLFYPCMPYAHKYADAAAEEGMLGAIKRFTPQGGFLSAAFRGGMSVALKDIEGIVTLLVDAEMKMFQGLNTPVIFLQNVVVDLLLGLGMAEAFRIFAKHVQKRYGAEPGFITMNLPMLLPVLAKLDLGDSVVCANINRIGFRMCGGLEAYDRTLREYKFRVIAMSVLASGAISPKEAIEWVCSRPNISSIVVGASTRSHIHAIKELVDENWRVGGEEQIPATLRMS